MSQNSNHQPLAEDKILILYLLKKAGKPLSYQELLELSIAASDINYFDFQQFLSELTEDNYITKSNEEMELYTLTPSGQESLELTLDLIPGITKLKIDSQFKENFNSIQNKFSISAEYTHIAEKDYMVTCSIIENHATIFKLETHIGSQEQANQIVNNWNKHAAQIYPTILENLVS